MTNRESALRDAGSKLFDLAIVGGGITGAGILKEAAEKGYTCILVEKGDFASGTSSKSAKLIHGGLRYLQYGHFRLVREGLLERNYLLAHYSHLVKPIPFLYLAYESVMKFRFGMFLYQLLGGNRRLPKYRFLSKEKVISVLPQVRREGLKGGFIYYDAITHDARLCNEVIHDAVGRYGAVAVNYLEMNRSKTNSDAVVLYCTDKVTGESLEVRARCLVNASGPWLDEVIGRSGIRADKTLAPSKGIHLVFSRNDFPTEHAIAFPTPFNDNRKLYALPWENNTVLVGATDTEYRGSPDAVVPGADDVQYIMEAIASCFPGLNLTTDHILSGFAGLRPLLMDDPASSKDKSRDFKIWWSGDRRINIVGGKLTTFGHMARALVAALDKTVRASGAAVVVEAINEEDVPEDLKGKYGSGAAKVAAILKEDPGTKQIFHDRYPISIAELLYLIRHQRCVHLADLVHRRLSLGYVLPSLPYGDALLKNLAEVMGKACGWSEEKKEEEIRGCLLPSAIIRLPHVSS